MCSIYSRICNNRNVAMLIKKKKGVSSLCKKHLMVEKSHPSKNIQYFKSETI